MIHALFTEFYKTLVAMYTYVVGLPVSLAISTDSTPKYSCSSDMPHSLETFPMCNLTTN